MKIRKYKIGHLGLKIALLSDLHNKPYETIISQLRAESPDIIAVAGDITYGLTEYDRVAGFISSCTAIAPTYVSLGNHDNIKEKSFTESILHSGGILLDNEYVDIVIKGIKLRIGGLSSPISYYEKSNDSDVEEVKTYKQNLIPKTDWLEDFCNTNQYKILLCHQPEFYPQYLSTHSIPLVLSGHAHGGQWRIPIKGMIGYHGIYAPGQGFFPKLTGGVHGNLVLSRGLSNTTWIPRFFNPREIVILDI